MYLKMAKRVLLETDKRLVWKFMRLMGWKGMRSVQKHKRRLKKGEYFPPFLYVSVINSCNLRCQGCWVDVAAKQQTIDLEAMNRLSSEAKEVGNVFFGRHSELSEQSAADRRLHQCLPYQHRRSRQRGMGRSAD